MTHVRNFDTVESEHTQRNSIMLQETHARRKKEAEAKAAKRQAESTQETNVRRELPRPRQLSANLDPTSHSYTF